MAKSQRRSSRETKKPKTTAAEKSKSPAVAIAGQIAGTPLSGSGSYKDRYK
jgi:hypothetical protein